MPDRLLSSRNGVYPAVQAMRLVVRSGREEQRVGRLRRHAIAEQDAPQPVDFNRLTTHRTQLAFEFACGEIPNGAKRAGILASVKPPGIVTGWNEESNTSTRL
jgi:hypothetical protein